MMRTPIAYTTSQAGKEYVMKIGDCVVYLKDNHFEIGMITMKRGNLYHIQNTTGKGVWRACDGKLLSLPVANRRAQIIEREVKKYLTYSE